MECLSWEKRSDVLLLERRVWRVLLLRLALVLYRCVAAFLLSIALIIYPTAVLWRASRAGRFG
jgi:hypothetical protein